MECTRPGTILIVDEDPAIRDSLEFALTLEGYAVRTYARAYDLLNDDNVPAPCCLVIDQQRLPDMEAMQFIDTMRRRLQDLPAILVTSWLTDADRRVAESTGVAIVEKPLTTGRLFQRIDAAFR